MFEHTTCRGFYLKNAQLMSTRDDFVPARYMQWMKDTQDCLPPVFKGQEAREFLSNMLREDLGLEFNDVFESFEDDPIGSIILRSRQFFISTRDS